MTMSTVSTLFALLFLAIAAWAAADALNLLLFRRPVAGKVVAHSYTEAERLAARAAHPMDWMYKVTAGNMKPVVKDVLTVEYEVGGQVYRRDIDSAHLRGDKAEAAMLVWYDPRDPERITTDGPGGAAFAAMVFLALAAWAGGIVSG